VADLAGNALGENRSWTFTTAPPSVASYTPTETIGVPRNIRPTATFSTNMNPSTITATNVKSSTGAALDQDVNTSGNQPESWTFTTGTLSAYSAVGNFSATQNPSGAWSYGYRASAGSGFVLYASHARPPRLEMNVRGLVAIAEG
jgi:hypothetical protein